MWNLASKNIKEILRDRKLLIVSFIAPLFLLLLSHFFIKHSQSALQNIPLAIVNPEHDFPKIGKLIVLMLKKAERSKGQSPIFDVQEVTEQEGYEAVRTGKVVGLILIPKGLTENLRRNNKERVLLVLNEEDWRSSMVSAAVQSLVEKLDFFVAKSKGKFEKESLQVAIVSQGNGVGEEAEVLASVFLFSFLSLIPCAAGQWIGEFERGSFVRYRLAVFPMPRLFAGSSIALLFLGLLQATTLLLFASWIGIKIDFLILWICPIVFFFVAASMGLGLILSAFLETEKQLNLALPLLIMPLYFFSSSFAQQLGFARFTTHLPWHQGFALISQCLALRTPVLTNFLSMILSTFAVSVIGIALFSLRRLRSE